MAAYRQAAANVHPLIAVVRLYDEVLSQIRLAIRAKEEKRHEDAFQNIMRATTILRGLAHNLDFDKGGALADRPCRVYTSNILALHTSLGKPDVAIRYTKLLAGLEELRNAWASIAGMKPAAATTW